MIYRHKALRVNYATYDMRRNQDYLIPGINANIMLIAREDENDKCTGMAKSLVSFTQMCGTQAAPSLVSRLNSTGWIFCGCVGLHEMVSTIQDGKPVVFHN